MVIDYLSDAGLPRIRCYTLFYRSEVLSFNCGLSVAKHLHRLSVMKNKSIGSSPQKSLSIKLYLKPNQTLQITI